MVKITTYNSIFDAPKYSSKGIAEKQYLIKFGLKLPEAQILIGTRQVLNLLDIKNWRIDVAGKIIHTSRNSAIQVPSQMRGMSDIIAIYKGRFLAIEVKKNGGYLKQAQLNYLNDVKIAGGLAFIVSDYTRLHEKLIGKVIKYLECEGIEIL